MLLYLPYLFNINYRSFLMKILEALSESFVLLNHKKTKEKYELLIFKKYSNTRMIYIKIRERYELLVRKSFNIVIY